jgi:hypothetical protein
MFINGVVPFLQILLPTQQVKPVTRLVIGFFLAIAPHCSVSTHSRSEIIKLAISHTANRDTLIISE